MNLVINQVSITHRVTYWYDLRENGNVPILK